MNLESIRYKNYVWKNNPKEIKVTYNRNVKETSVPYSYGIVRDYGKKMRIVTGVGEFFGDKYIEEFEELKNLHKQGTLGYLTLPKEKPFLAIFKSLKMKQTPTPRLLEYSFEFVEYTHGCSSKSCYEKSYHVVKTDESLWDIANKYDKSIDELIELNPFIKRPDTLRAGERVKIL